MDFCDFHEFHTCETYVEVCILIMRLHYWKSKTTLQYVFTWKLWSGTIMRPFNVLSSGCIVKKTLCITACSTIINILMFNVQITAFPMGLSWTYCCRMINPWWATTTVLSLKWENANEKEKRMEWAYVSLELGKTHNAHHIMYTFKQPYRNLFIVFYHFNLEI